MTRQSVAVVPAAGRSERFGSMKLVADISGEPLLNHTLRSLLGGGVTRVVVVLAPDAKLGAVSLLADARVSIVVNPDPSRGMFSSVQTGLAVADGAPILVLPADMPFVKSATVAAVEAECERTGDVVVPGYEGRRGHPIGLPSRLLAALLAADPNRSLRDALQQLREAPNDLDVNDAGILRDVDVKADL